MRQAKSYRRKILQELPFLLLPLLRWYWPRLKFFREEGSAVPFPHLNTVTTKVGIFRKRHFSAAPCRHRKPAFLEVCSLTTGRPPWRAVLGQGSTTTVQRPLNLSAYEEAVPTTCQTHFISVFYKQLDSYCPNAEVEQGSRNFAAGRGRNSTRSSC